LEAWAEKWKMQSKAKMQFLDQCFFPAMCLIVFDAASLGSENGEEMLC
jgi:hypothetical protein